jgi:hypothetical protein
MHELEQPDARLLKRRQPDDAHATFAPPNHFRTAIASLSLGNCLPHWRQLSHNTKWTSLSNERFEHNVSVGKLQTWSAMFKDDDEDDDDGGENSANALLALFEDTQSQACAALFSFWHGHQIVATGEHAHNQGYEKGITSFAKSGNSCDNQVMWAATTSTQFSRI